MKLDELSATENSEKGTRGSITVNANGEKTTHHEVQLRNFGEGRGIILGSSIGRSRNIGIGFPKSGDGSHVFQYPEDYSTKDLEWVLIEENGQRYEADHGQLKVTFSDNSLRAMGEYYFKSGKSEVKGIFNLIDTSLPQP